MSYSLLDPSLKSVHFFSNKGSPVYRKHTPDDVKLAKSSVTAQRLPLSSVPLSPAMRRQPIHVRDPYYTDPSTFQSPPPSINTY